MSWNNNGPWGSNSPGNNEPPKKPKGAPPPNEVDVDEWLRKGRDRLRQTFKGGSAGPGGSRRWYSMAALVLVGLWVVSGFYQVSQNQLGVVLRFGKATRTENPGLHYHLPSPIESVLLPDVTSVNQIQIGDNNNDVDDIAPGSEGRMLTGDENIVDLNFSVFWRVKEPVDYLFNIRNPQLTVKLVAESAMREVVGKMEIQPILTEKRSAIEVEAAALIQAMLDDYKSGISIMQVQLLKVSPPQPVVDAFNDVQRARADGERARNEAQSYANDILPRARGEAQKMLQEAAGYKDQAVSLAKGEAGRFESVLKAYNGAKEVTATRLYYEAMEEVLGNSNKILIDPAATKGGTVPYLPLNEMIPTKPKEDAQ
jgi:membrane protease subunit HflK